MERRIEKVQVGEDEMYHLDEVIDVETIEEDVDHFDAGDRENPIPDGVWSEESLTRTPPQPSWEVELLADQVEERRLKKMGVIEDLDVSDLGLDKLTAKFVRDWRVKTRQMPDGSSRKQWMRRSRLVAREYAVEKRDDVYSPASGSHALRLLSVLYLAMRSLGYDHDEETGKPSHRGAGCDGCFPTSTSREGGADHNTLREVQGVSKSPWTTNWSQGMVRTHQELLGGGARIPV